MFLTTLRRGAFLAQQRFFINFTNHLSKLHNHGKADKPYQSSSIS